MHGPRFVLCYGYMPRKPREFEIGKIYHIVNRGVEQRKIFLKNQDYSRFVFALELLNDERLLNLWDILSRKNGVNSIGIGNRLRAWRQKQKRRLVDILAFALMPNHYHLILQEIRQRGISLFMQKLGGYSTYFNKQYNRVGPLFQSRYKAVPIKNDIQLGVVFVYVHTNPVELIEPGWKEFRVRNPASAIAHLEQYRWSSYRDFIGLSDFSPTIQQDFFLKFYGTSANCRKAIEEWIKYKAQKTALGPEVIE